MIRKTRTKHTYLVLKIFFLSEAFTSFMYLIKLTWKAYKLYGEPTESELVGKGQNIKNQNVESQKEHQKF